jgi:hypothetical protein
MHRANEMTVSRLMGVKPRVRDGLSEALLRAAR